MSESELPPLDPELRALIDAAHEVGDPAPSQRAHTFAGLEAKIAAGAVGGTAAAVGWVSSAKAAIVVAAVAAIAAAAVWGAHVGRPRPREAVPHTVTHNDRPAPSSVAGPGSVASEPEQHAAPLASGEGAKPARKEGGLPNLDGETDLLRAANGALNHGDGTRALKLLAQYDRRFPAGVLREERSATEVVALCAAGRSAEALALARGFINHYPRSPLLARVAGVCAADAATKDAL